MNKNFWREKKVLITGYEGFLGSNLTKALLKTKAKVVGLDIKVFRKETLLCPDDYKRMVVYKGSVTNYKLIQDILRKHSINAIFHLAAEAIVGRSQKNPRWAFHANITGTWNVLEAARQKGGIEAIIVASSDKAYGSHKRLPYREDMPLIANHPYDVSKSCADLIAHTYARTYGLPVAITRCGNIFGQGDFNFSRIVPDSIRSALKDKTLVIRSDGTFTRDYIYVKDIVSAYLLLAIKMSEFKSYSEAFNFSNEQPISVLELVKEISKLSGQKKPDYIIADQARYEIRHQYLSAAKAKRMLGWKPEFTLEEGLRETISWYKKIL